MKPDLERRLLEAVRRKRCGARDEIGAMVAEGAIANPKQDLGWLTDAAPPG